jgi:hypothetical protein
MEIPVSMSAAAGSASTPIFCISGGGGRKRTVEVAISGTIGSSFFSRTTFSRTVSVVSFFSRPSASPGAAAVAPVTFAPMLIRRRRVVFVSRNAIGSASTIPVAASPSGAEMAVGGSAAAGSTGTGGSPTGGREIAVGNSVGGTGKGAGTAAASGAAGAGWADTGFVSFFSLPVSFFSRVEVSVGFSEILILGGVGPAIRANPYWLVKQKNHTWLTAGMQASDGHGVFPVVVPT